MSDVKRLLMSDFTARRLFWRTTSVSSQTDIYGDTLFYPELIQVLHKQNRKYCDFRSLSKFLIYAGNNWTWQWTRLKLLKHRCISFGSDVSFLYDTSWCGNDSYLPKVLYSVQQIRSAGSRDKASPLKVLDFAADRQRLSSKCLTTLLKQFL